MTNFFANLRNMPFLVFVILLVLSICMLMVVQAEISVSRNSSQSTELTGFLEYAVNLNGQGNVDISKEDIFIEALNSTQPRVMVYASTTSFDWNFSATPISANGDCHPVAFSIDWRFGELLVWGGPVGWFYNYRNSTDLEIWNSSGIVIETTFSLNSKYDVAIKWQKAAEEVAISFAISDSTSMKNVAQVVIPVPNHANIEYATLYLESFANINGSSKARFNNSHFVSYNSAKFTEQSSVGSLVIFIGSIVASILTVLTLIAKFRGSATVIHQFLLRIRNAISLVHIQELIGRLTSNLGRYNAFILLLLFFGVLRIALAAVAPGHLFDTHATKTWINIITTKGPAAVFAFSDVLPPFMGLRPVFPYPPIIAYILSILPSVQAQNGLVFLVSKSPGIVADLLLGLVVFFTFKNREGISVAIPALFLSLLNFVNSSIWGQYDSVVSLFLVLAVWLVATRRIEIGWIFMALAISTKQTALVLLPALLVLTFKQKVWSRLFYGLITFAAVIFIIWYPFLQNGLSFDYAMGASGLRLWSPGGGMDPIAPEGGGGTSIWALNIWPIVTYLIKPADGFSFGLIGGVKDTFPTQFFSLNYFQLGLVLFGLTYVVLSIRIWKASGVRNEMLLFSVLLLSFFILPTRVHERYLFLPLAFLPFAYNKSKTIVGSYIVLLVTYTLNLVYSLIGGPFYPLANTIFNDGVLFVLSSANVLVFILLILPSSNMGKSLKMKLFSRSPTL